MFHRGFERVEKTDTLHSPAGIEYAISSMELSPNSHLYKDALAHRVAMEDIDEELAKTLGFVMTVPRRTIRRETIAGGSWTDYDLQDAKSSGYEGLYAASPNVSSLPLREYLRQVFYTRSDGTVVYRKGPFSTRPDNHFGIREPQDDEHDPIQRVLRASMPTLHPDQLRKVWELERQRLPTRIQAGVSWGETSNGLRYPVFRFTRVAYPALASRQEPSRLRPTPSGV